MQSCLVGWFYSHAHSHREQQDLLQLAFQSALLEDVARDTLSAGASTLSKQSFVLILLMLQQQTVCTVAIY